MLTKKRRPSGRPFQNIRKHPSDMKILPFSFPILLRLSFSALLLLSVVSVARAHPYASGITNSGGLVKFILNENAESVKVAFDNGATTNDLGAWTKGIPSFAPGAHTNYAIIVY